MRRHVPLAAVLLLAAGCGASSDATMSGAVTLNGQPLAQGYISFTPLGAQGGTAGGDIKAGRYRVAGLKPGKYQVQIVGVPEGPVIQPGSNEAKKPLSDQDVRALMNPLLPDTTGTEQDVEVRAGAQSRDFKLESRGRP